MPLRCAMGRRGSGGEEHQHQQQEQQQQPAAVPRRGRWLDGEQPRQPAAGWRCGGRSCAAAAIADCVALGCCPCAVVALLGLALVRAPLAVGRRLRGRRRSALRRKRVRDVAAAARGGKGAAKVATGAAPGAGGGTTLLDPAGAAAPVHHHPQQQQTQTQSEAEELAWLDEMYRVGHWGFGRVSFSGSAGKTP